MNEKLDSNAIRQMLNRSAARLDQPALARLREARELALARYDARQAAPAFAWADTGSHGFTGGLRTGYYYLASAILLAAFLFSLANLGQHALEHDESEVDIAILTDEMPIDVFVD